VAEDAADPYDVEPEVHDQVAREGVPEVVKPQGQRAVAQAGSVGRVRERAALRVALDQRSSVAGREHPVTPGLERRVVPMGAEDRGELRGEWNISDRAPGFRRDASCGLPDPGARELGANMEGSADEIDVVPDQPEQFGDAPPVNRPVASNGRYCGRQASSSRAISSCPSARWGWCAGRGRSHVSSFSIGFSWIQLFRTANRITVLSVPSAPATVFSARPLARNRSSSKATSDTVISRTSHDPRIGSRWLSRW